MAEFIIGSPLRQLARRHRPLRQILWRLDYALLWLLQKILLCLPVDASSRMGERLGRFIGPRLKRKTAIYRENLAIAFPELSAAQLDDLIHRAWGRAGRILAEYPHLATFLENPERLEIEIREPIPTFADTSQPCVVVSAHVSNWEVVCSAMARLGMPNASLYSPPTNPFLDRMLLESRQALDCELLPRDNSARALMKAMKEGRTAGMVMDRRVDDGKPIRFFGHDKLSTIMPAKLALKFNCALVPAQVERLQDARYRVTFHPPIRPSLPHADEVTRAIDMTQQLHDQFEDWIRQKPEDWFCSKRLWPKGKIDEIEEADREADIDSYAA
ncbi:MAG: lauroyl acyltransferase [Pseudomonadota bacterium]